ncbi:NlpC/P60 family protein [Hansschlegelia quercus]|uniref:NlpC/P60 family protein n=1 Tax=Hansschlegelia quercus TaxID=2528245 RepID=UPI001FDF3BCB|nr:NlpC/P60 family protein [Hansschlegelia quercus]
MVNALCEERPATLDGALVVSEAQTWIGTPYRHRASLRGAGADCLGVIRGVWRALIGPEPEDLPPYARSWAEDGAGEPMLDAALRWLVRQEAGPIEPGDVLLFRVARGGPAKHAGIATGARMMVHAYDGHAVTETPIPEAWERRIVGRFRFPAAETACVLRDAR